MEVDETEWGGITDVPLARDRKVTLGGVEVEVVVAGEEALEKSLGVIPGVVFPVAPKVTLKKAKKKS